MFKDFLDLLMDYQNGIYVVLGILLLIYLKKLISAVTEWKSTFFGLERESAQGKLNSALVMVVLLVLLIAAEFIIVTFVFPDYPSVIAPSQTETPVGSDAAAAQTAVVQTETAAGGSSLIIRNLPEGAEIQNKETISGAGLLTGGCIDGQLEWLEPLYGEEISGSYYLSATVNVKDMAFYQYAYSSLAEPDEWNIISGGNLPVIEGSLGLWATSEVPNGNYILHLLVYGLDNQPLPSCDVTIRVQNETD